MKMFLLSAIVCSSTVLCRAQMQTAMPLWPGGAPGALGTSSNDIPTLTPYLPDPASATGAALVICPGGGYEHLAPHEGNDYALWLNQHGVTAFVLQYRLGSSGYHHPAMLQDAARAVRLVRFHAADWNLDAKRIGIIGSSAGGHLASTLLTHFDLGQTNAADPVDLVSCRPDLGVLCYAVITMGEFTHHGTRDNLLGTNASPELIRELSNELHVTPQTPPCFLLHTDEDKAVPVENSLAFAAALRRAGVSFELHIYQSGPHGIGLGSATYDPARWHPWTRDCRLWLAEQGFGR